MSLVRDYEPDEFLNNVLALADTAKHFKLPTILTTSFEQGPKRRPDPGTGEGVPGRPVRPAPRPDQRLGQPRLC